MHEHTKIPNFYAPTFLGLQYSATVHSAQRISNVKGSATISESKVSNTRAMSYCDPMKATSNQNASPWTEPVELTLKLTGKDIL